MQRQLNTSNIQLKMIMLNLENEIKNMQCCNCSRLVANDGCVLCSSLDSGPATPTLKILEHLSRYNDERDVAKELLTQHSDWLQNFKQVLFSAALSFCIQIVF